MFSSPPAPRRTSLALRGTLVFAGLVAGSAAVGRLALPHLVVTDPARLSGLVAAGCALALLSCWCWVLLGALDALLVACRVASRTGLRHPSGPGSGSARPSPGPAPAGSAGPRVVRMLVWALLGLGYAAPPALAGGPTDIACDRRAAPAELSGLALPQLPATPRHRHSAGSPSGPSGAAAPATGPATTPAPGQVRSVRLRPGDSLWLVAERVLPPGADDRAVDRGWRRIARANPRAVGADPDLVFPGTVLRVPVPLTADAKDRS